MSEYDRSRSFYEGALAPLGYSMMLAHEEWKLAGFGTGAKPEFWICRREPPPAGRTSHSRPGSGHGRAFTPPLSPPGASDNGAPACGPNTDAAATTAPSCSIPNGNNVKLVCHLPASAA